MTPIASHETFRAKGRKTRLFVAECTFGPALLDRLAAGREVARSLEAFARFGTVPPGPVQGTPQPVLLLRRQNFIDDEIFGTMERAGVRSSSLSDDSEFLRRVTLDLTGRIPTHEETLAFLNGARENRRLRKIDELLGSEAFVDRWTLFLDELFKVTAYSTTSAMGFKGRDAWHRYFSDAIRRRLPYDRIAREVLTGTGSNWTAGTANFAVRDASEDGPDQDTFDNLAATTGRALLGLNTSCISCHNGAGHTDQMNLWLSTKTRRNFWQTAAFFARTQVNFEEGEGPNDYRYDVREVPDGEYMLNTTEGNKTPRGPGSDGVDVVLPAFILTGETPRTGESYREAVARMATSHRQFSRATVNYVWKELFTLGMVEPADGFDLFRLDPANPPPAPWTIQPTHPALLEKLSAEFEKTHDLRALIRLIVRSSAYQLSSSYPGEWKDSYIPLFARHYPRRLRAEELADALSVATASPLPFYVNGWTQPVFWAGQLPDTLEPAGEDESGMSYLVGSFLDSFGRGDRDARPKTTNGSILQALQLLNSPLVIERTRPDLDGTLVARLLGSALPDDAIVDVLYVTALSRHPSALEKTRARAILTDRTRSRGEALQDLHFAVLNKMDFLFNH